MGSGKKVNVRVGGRMDARVAQLLSLAGDQKLVFKEKEESLLQLALLLERASSGASPDSFYQEFLQPAVAGIKLSPNDQEEVISGVCAILNGGGDQSDELTSSLLAVLGFSRRPSALRQLLAFLHERGHRGQSSILRQIVGCLSGFIFIGDEDEIGIILSNSSLSADLQRILPSGDEALDERITGMLRELSDP